MPDLFATVDIYPDGPIQVYNRENGDVIFSCLSESFEIPPVIEFLHANFGENLKIYFKDYGFDQNKLPEGIENVAEVVKQYNLVILLETNLNIGEKFVYVNLEKKQTIFELYQVTKPKIAEKINDFCVSALLDKQLTVYTDFDIILFALGIKEKEAYLVLKQTGGYIFGNVVDKFGDKFIKCFRADSLKFENYVRSFEFNPNFIKIYQGDLVTIDETANLEINCDKPFICPKPLQNYEFKPNLMGIDLGTTHLCLAVSRNGRIEPIPIDNSGDLWISSAIYFGKEQPIVGKVAVNRLQDEPDSVIVCPKTMPSFGFGSSFGYIQGAMVQYHTGKANFNIKSDGQIRQISLTDVIALFMETMQNAASEYQSELNGKNVMKQAVLTVPQWPNKPKITPAFDNLWINAIIEAGIKLGIEILDIIPEVYADFLYYLSKYDVKEDENVLVIDCGGGRTALQRYKIVNEDGQKRITHMPSPCCGSWHYTANVLGGVHFENRIITEINKILKYQKINPMETKKSRFKFFKAIQKIKHEITQENQVSVDMSELGSKINNVDFVLKKTDLDDIFRKEMVERFVEVLDYWTKGQSFDWIFLAGGTSRISILRDVIKREFPNVEIIMDPEVEVITATGAAIHGLQILNGEIEPFTEFQRFRNFDHEIDESVENLETTENMAEAISTANGTVYKDLLPEK